MCKLIGNCGHYDDCRRCMCYTCDSTALCKKCIDCTGSMSMNDDPYANFRDSCNEFKPSIEYNTSDLNSDRFKDIISRRNAKVSCIIVDKGGKDALIESCKRTNSTYITEELNSYQTARQDEIENSIFDMIKILTCNDELNWNMELIGDIADAVCDILTNKGYLIYYPNRTIDKKGNIAISDFYGI